MIRTGEDEFFIEPLDLWRPEGEGGGGKEEEEEEGRQHIVYRSSAIIKKNSAVNQTADNIFRGERNKYT